MYVSELMRHIRVDSYGACLHNKDFPKEADPDNPVNSRENNDFAIGKNAVTRRCAMRPRKYPHVVGTQQIQILARHIEFAL